MKNKLFIAVVLLAVVLVSFSFTTARKPAKAKAETSNVSNEPAGGFISESKF